MASRIQGRSARPNHAGLVCFLGMDFSQVVCHCNAMFEDARYEWHSIAMCYSIASSSAESSEKRAAEFILRCFAVSARSTGTPDGTQ